MARFQCHFTVTDGKVSAVTVEDPEQFSGTFIVGWGISEQEEKLVVMFSSGDGESTLQATATTFFPKLPAAQRP